MEMEVKEVLTRDDKRVSGIQRERIDGDGDAGLFRNHATRSLATKHAARPAELVTAPESGSPQSTRGSFSG